MAIKSLKSSSIRNNVFYRSMLAGNEHFGKVNYWLATLGGVDGDEAYGIALDSQGNAFAIGLARSAGAGQADFLLVKYDPTGNVLWQRTLGGATFDFGAAITIDTADNAYVLGYTNSTGPAGDNLLIAKYNSAGTIQWQRTLGGAGDDRGTSITSDSSNNVYLLGWTNSAGAGARDFLISKYNSAGTIQWQRTLGSAASQEGYGISIDSLSNVYVTGYTDEGAPNNFLFLLAKYNSSGVIQWQRTLGGTDYDVSNATAVDSADNVYMLGRTPSAGAGGNDFLLAKYNASGTLQWQRVLGGAATDIGNALALDSLDNVYAFGITGSTGAGGDDFLISKYNSSGTIQWQRTLGSTGAETGFGVAVNALDEIYVLGITNATGEGSIDFLIGKIPSDGSLTGTYVLDGVNMVYAASSLTAATSTLTGATSTLTDASSSLTDATSSLTSSSASLTSHFVKI